MLWIQFQKVKYQREMKMKSNTYRQALEKLLITPHSWVKNVSFNCHISKTLFWMEDKSIFVIIVLLKNVDNICSSIPHSNSNSKFLIHGLPKSILHAYWPIPYKYSGRSANHSICGICSGVQGIDDMDRFEQEHLKSIIAHIWNYVFSILSWYTKIW